MTAGSGSGTDTELPSRLSQGLPDLSALVLAASIGGVLLTGDRRLSMGAERDGVDANGVQSSNMSAGTIPCYR